MKLNKMLQPLLLTTALLTSTFSAHAISLLADGGGTKLDSTKSIDDLTGYSNPAAAKTMQDNTVFNWVNNDQTALDWLEHGHGAGQIHKDIAGQLYKALTNGDKLDPANDPKYANLTAKSYLHAITLGHNELAKTILYILLANNKLAPTVSNPYLKANNLAKPNLQPTSTIEEIRTALAPIPAAPQAGDTIKFSSARIVQSAKDLGMAYLGAKELLDASLHVAFGEIGFDDVENALKALLAELGKIALQ